MSDPQSSQPRHEWMPNRMFDPANNPFAIQNLLKKEKDDTFLVKRDERPTAAYTDTALLKEIHVPTDDNFQLDKLLDQTLPSVPAFQSQTQNQSSLQTASKLLPDVSHQPLTEDSVAIQETSQNHATDSEVDQTLPSPLPEVASSTDDVRADLALEPTEHLATDPSSDALSGVELAEQELSKTGMHVQAEQPAPEQIAENEIDACTATDSNEHEITTAIPPTTLAFESDNESSTPDSELIEMTSDAASEDGSSPQAQPDTPLGLDNEAVTQLIEAAREQARVDAHAAGFQEGLEAGLEQATSEMQAKIDEKLAAMDLVMKGLHQLERDPDALFEPMKKLAMHLAQQLVRGELTQSGQVIARLVDNCLRELAASGEKAVIIHLHPDDLEQYKPLIAQFGDSIVCRPDGLLSRGSVRASLDGSVVEDMIERRVKGLTKSLAQPVASSWRPALPTPSTKPKSNVAAQPAVMATPDTTIKADELEHDHDDEEIIHDNDDDAMIDAMIDASTLDNSDQIHADRNDETNS
ncbi:MAG: hypothetical protein LW714_00105 [Oxalobacteraceae bacterium]|nr:hypothetical protein [Oxalobacteraceae bacterium]